MRAELNTARKLAAMPIATSTRGEAIPTRGPTTVAAAIANSAVTTTTNNSVMRTASQKRRSR
jgi:hypothetical protein